MKTVNIFFRSSGLWTLEDGTVIKDQEMAASLVRLYPTWKPATDTPYSVEAEVEIGWQHKTIDTWIDCSQRDYFLFSSIRMTVRKVAILKLPVPSPESGGKPELKKAEGTPEDFANLWVAVNKGRIPANAISLVKEAYISGLKNGANNHHEFTVDNKESQEELINHLSNNIIDLKWDDDWIEQIMRYWIVSRKNQTK